MLFQQIKTNFTFWMFFSYMFLRTWWAFLTSEGFSFIHTPASLRLCQPSASHRCGPGWISDPTHASSPRTTLPLRWHPLLFISWVTVVRNISLSPRIYCFRVEQITGTRKSLKLRNKSQTPVKRNRSEAKQAEITECINVFMLKLCMWCNDDKGTKLISRSIRVHMLITCNLITLNHCGLLVNSGSPH